MNKLLLIIGLLTILFISGCEVNYEVNKPTGNINYLNSTESINSIKEITQNPNDYVGKEVEIKGELREKIGGYLLMDNEEYWVWIEEKTCMEAHRDYKTGQIYTAKGFFRKAENEWAALDYWLECSNPMG